jgi:DNA-binding CsgD family transcriptional regulator
MSLDGSKGSVVFQVVARDASLRADIQRHLRNGGYLVLEDGRLDGDAELATVIGEIEITPQEREVLMALTRHDDSSAIARALCISPRTVGNHIQHLFGKLRVHRRHRLLARAIGLGLIKTLPDP